MKARKTDFNKESWIVFSDRNDNDTYHNPGGKVKLKKMDFMEPFFVIKRKGEYLRLVKYDPDVVQENGFVYRFTDRKKAQYYGWVHSSRLVMSKQSGTDVSSGLKTKAISIVSDTTAVVEPRIFFESDSIWTYKDDMLTVKNGKIPFYGIFYILKKSADREKMLVSRKAIISPDESATETLGWIPASLVDEMGERLFVDMEPIVDKSPYLLHFTNKGKSDSLEIGPSAYSKMKRYSKENPSLRFNPVFLYQEKDNGESRFSTALPTPVVDTRHNYVLNVNGNKIMYDEFMTLEKDLKKLNVMFVFEGKQRVLQSFSEIMNVIQNLQTLFTQPEDDFQYRFGAVVAYGGEINGTYNTIAKSKGLTGSYDEVLEFLMNEKDNVGKYRPLTSSWEGIRKAVDVLPTGNKETNLMIIIGEEGYSESADSVLVRRLADANCRILGYQVHSEISNTGNNFVLQVENMITHCATRESFEKRERIVYADQVKPRNAFRESSRNVYALDYPENSMSQGWLLFPDKSIDVPLLDILSSAIDTFVTEVKTDNNLLISSLYTAFETVGNNRHLYDSLWVNYNHKDPSWELKKELPYRLSQKLPAWNMNSLPLFIQKDNRPEYYLLLSESELKDVMEFLEGLSKYEPDYKYIGGEKRKERKACNCPDDEIYAEWKKSQTVVMENNVPQYLNTRKIRRHLYKLYMSELKDINRLCKFSNGTFKSYTLARSQKEIIGNPTTNDMLKSYIVRDIKRKNNISDQQLDKLILYFKDKKEQLDQHIRTTTKDVFVSNGEKYYWIDEDLLP